MPRMASLFEIEYSTADMGCSRYGHGKRTLHLVCESVNINLKQSYRYLQARPLET